MATPWWPASEPLYFEQVSRVEIAEQSDLLEGVDALAGVVIFHAVRWDYLLTLLWFACSLGLDLPLGRRLAV